MERKENVMAFLEKHMAPKTREKTMKGEVFTPLDIVEEMLSQFPSEVWSNKDLTWLDPANGIGNFPIMVYFRLMDGLKREIPDEKRRSRHIIENMLFMNEIQSKNNRLCRRVFEMLDPDAKPNLVTRDFLRDDFSKGLFGLRDDFSKGLFDLRDDFSKGLFSREGEEGRFDIVLGNPPYNQNGIRSYKKGLHQEVFSEEGSYKSIWPQFLQKSLGLLRDSESMLCFLTPCSWTHLQGPVASLILSKQIMSMRFYRHFHPTTSRENVSISLAFYLLKNKESRDLTKIYDSFLQRYVPFDIVGYNFVPTTAVSIFKKVLDVTKQVGSLDPFVTKSVRPDPTKISRTKDKQHPFTLVKTKRREIEIVYSSESLFPNADPKLVFTNFMLGYPILDKEGDMVPMSNSLYLLQFYTASPYETASHTEPNGSAFRQKKSLASLKKIQQIFYTKVVCFLIRHTYRRQGFLDPSLFVLLPDLSQESVPSVDLDAWLYERFGFSLEERGWIEQESCPTLFPKEFLSVSKRNHSKKNPVLKRYSKQKTKKVHA